MTTTPLRITVWGENVHEQVEQHVAERYPDGMHGAIADGIRENLPDAVVRTATMQEPEHGFFLVGMKSYGRAPTFLLATGYEQVRSITAWLAGDLASASRVELTLPATGVCSTDAGGCC